MSDFVSGRIVDQKIVEKKNGDPAVILVVRHGDESNPVESDVWLSFSVSNLKGVEKSYTILKSLGFDDLDFTKLDSNHEDYVNLKGKSVTVASSRTDDGRVFWNIIPQKKTNISAIKAYMKDRSDLLAAAYKGREEAPF